jgi:hypothetical protein
MIINILVSQLLRWHWNNQPNYNHVFITFEYRIERIAAHTATLVFMFIAAISDL